MTIMVGSIKNNGIWEGSFKVDCVSVWPQKTRGVERDAAPPRRDWGGQSPPHLITVETYSAGRVW